MLKHSNFLKYKSSQKAAAALLLSLNINQSKLAPVVGIEKIPESKFANLVYETLKIHKEVNIGKNHGFHPLYLWNNSIEKLTFLRKEVDVKPTYRALLNSVNDNCYYKKLSNDPTLFC